MVSKGRRWCYGDETVWQCVPDLGGGKRKSSAADGRQSEGWYNETVGARGAEWASSRYIGNTVEWSRILGRDATENLATFHRAMLRRVWHCYGKSSVMVRYHNHMCRKSSKKNSECPDVKNCKWRLNPVWHSMLYSCTHDCNGGCQRAKKQTHLIAVSERRGSHAAGDADAESGARWSHHADHHFLFHVLHLIVHLHLSTVGRHLDKTQTRRPGTGSRVDGGSLVWQFRLINK